MEPPAKRQKTLACQRCRSRKQKCNDKRPCENCTQANKECISSDPVDRRKRFSAEYTRSLQERIAILEGQYPSPSQDTSSPTARQARYAENLPSDDEGPDLQPNSVAAPASASAYHIPTSYSPSHRSDEGSQQPEIEPTHHLVLPQCPSANILLSSPLHASTSDQQLIANDQCGHSTLLVNILAALSSGNPCGIKNVQNGALQDIEVPLSRAAEPQKSRNRISLPINISDTLVEIYLQRVNPRYPFLHVETFRGWYRSWKACRQVEPTADQQDRWKDFFVVMVQAVSILLTPQVSQSDITTSQSLYNMAMNLLPFVFTQTNPVLHVQAYLLLTLHALHSPSSQMIVSMVSATMRQCAINQLHLSDTEPKVQFPAFSLDVQIRRRVFWSAYALDRLISWIYHIPNNLNDEHITVEMFSNVEDTHLYLDTTELDQDRASELPQRTHISPAMHLIRCRCIQSRIISTMMRSDFDKISASSTWRQHMLEELESWRTHLKRLSHRSSKGYLSDRWVGMAYNYTVLLIHQPTKENVYSSFGDKAVKACVQIMLTFRDFQKDRQTAQLWPGLLSQFNTGVMFLYCFWATPTSSRTSAYSSSNVPEALRACSTSLAILSERWVQAEPLRDVFDILAREIPLHDAGSIPLRMSPDAATHVKAQMDWLKLVVKNRGVLRMIAEMIDEDFPASPSENNVQLHGQLNVLQETDEHSCSEHCSLFPGTVFDTSATSMRALEGEIEDFDDSFMFPSFFGSAEF